MLNIVYNFMILNGRPQFFPVASDPFGNSNAFGFNTTPSNQNDFFGGSSDWGELKFSNTYSYRHITVQNTEL